MFIQTENPALTIVQSGPHLQFVLNDAQRTMLWGTIEELHVTTTSPTSNRSSHISLLADLNRRTEPDMLQGLFTFTGCPSQPTVAFTAVRQPAAAR